MKKIKITIFLVTLYSSAWGQTNTFPTSGKVGIGTTSPSEEMHIDGQLATILLERAGTVNDINGRIELTTPSGQEQLRISTSSGDIEFQSSNNDNQLFLDESGNVGIGTANPNSLLEVKSPHTANQDDEIRLGSYYQSLFYGLGLNYRLSSNGTPSNHLVSYYGGNRTTTMSFKGNKVGIGTLSPQSDLEIYEYGGSSEIKIHTNQHAGIAKLELAGGSALLDSNPDNYSGWSIYHSYVSTGKDLYFRHGESGNPSFVLTDNGRVGIGTASPKSELAVNGQIRATEVKVLADISVPDYVFESDYELRTLKETKEYITENKHLPEIPSAAEIGENGIDLGDMNMRLLKKIEELTLYVIEQNEQIKKLQTSNVRIDELEKKIELLTKN